LAVRLAWLFVTEFMLVCLAYLQQPCQQPSKARANIRGYA
jgi:hypothetical protein